MTITLTLWQWVGVVVVGAVLGFALSAWILDKIILGAFRLR